MKEGSTPKSEKRLIASEYVKDAVIVEAVLNIVEGRTSFIVSSNAGVERRATWSSGGVTYVPIPASNNLIRHRALLLASDAAEYRGEAALFDELRDHLGRYVTLEPDDLDIAASYVLLTWLYDAFNELPYLRFRGDYGTGKTRALLVIGSLCYKAFFASGASTVSPIFHTLDTFRATLVFDEADFRFTDEKAELVKILNNGNVRGFPVLRTHVTPAKEFDPRAFNVFGPKVVAMRGEYQDRALESRFVTIEMQSGRTRSPISMPAEQADEANELRNKLLTFRFRRRHSAQLQPSYAHASLEPRMNQILLPLLSIAPNEAVRHSIIDRALGAQRRTVVERSTTPEGHVLSALMKLGREGDGTVSLNAVASAFVEEFGSEYERPVTNRYLGGVLRRLGIALYKKHGVYVVSPGQAERIFGLARRFGVSDSGVTDGLP